MVTGARTYGTLLPVPSADGTVCCEGGFVVRDEDVFGFWKVREVVLWFERAGS